ncbi:MAG TPA: hypothetical protein VLH61_10540 [Bacteroidales bacterium]|nr:hypothetical protein [Bacteroidales bacterium]
MENINKFSFYRIWLLIKRNATMNMKTWIIGIGALNGLVIIVSLLQPHDAGVTQQINEIAYAWLIYIFIGGYIITSKTYNELHTPASGQFFLTLPATNGEKLLAHWFLTSVLFLLVANIALFTGLFFSSMLAAIIYGSQIDLFNPFSTANIRLMGFYMVSQSPFLLGAIYFRKNNFLKTLLCVFAVVMLISIWTAFTVWLFFDVTDFTMFIDTVNQGFDGLNINLLPTAAKVIYWGVVTPFFLTVSYFALKEREI